MTKTHVDFVEMMDNEFIAGVYKVNGNLGLALKVLYDKGDKETFEQLLLNEDFRVEYEDDDQVIYWRKWEVFRISYN